MRAVMEYLGCDDTDVVNLAAFKYIDPESPGMTLVLEHSDRDIRINANASEAEEE